MKVDDDAISQDDSGFLRAGRLIAYSNKADKPINTIGYSEYSEWIDDNNLRFGVSSRDEMRTLKADIINDEYPVDEVRDIYERMFGDDPGGKSIAQKTGNFSEFTDESHSGFTGGKADYGVFGDDYEYETEDEDETDEDSDEVGSEDEDATQAVDKGLLEGYPSLPPEDAAPEAKEFVQRVAEEGYDDDEALLYQLLGSGTPEWKMSKEDAGYKDEPEENMVCSNCQYYYEGTDGEAVCSKVRGEVFPEHWCELWAPGDDTNVSKSESFVSLNINGESLLLEEADTQEKRYTGLSKYDSLDDIDGMLFRYPREEAHRLVWRDMSFPVDVVHLDKDNKVVQTGSLKGEGDFVQAVSKTALEVPRGFVIESDIEVGQSIQSLAKGSDGSDNLFEKIVSSSYHRDRKIRQQGEQLSLDVVERIDEAFREQVWPDEIQKSPSWQDDSDVGEETEEWVEAVLDMKDPMWDEYDGVPMAAGMTVKQEIRESITQPQGWSLDSIVDRLDNEFPQLEDFNKRRIARQEVAGVLNGAKITALLARPEDPKVKWVGPDDANTTELCEEVKSEVGDGVPVSELIELLEEKADSFEGGTPRRADEGLPHFLCRHTLEVVDE